MNLRWSTFLVVGLAALTSCSIPDNCPTKKDITPCTCKPNYDGACVIQCQDATYDNLLKLSKLPNLCKGHVHFVLDHSYLAGIPGSLWRVLLSSKTVDVSLKYSTMSHLVSPGEETQIQSVSTPGGASLKVTHCGDITGWRWSQLKGFTPSGDLSVVIDDTPMAKLNPEFVYLGGGKVNRVTIDQAGLETLPPGVFSTFSELKSFSLQLNELAEIARSALPRPATKLQFLHLNGNSIGSIPDDLFADMPSLQVVYLRENKLTTLPDNIFSLSNSKVLNVLDFIQNPWRCDCKLMKIVNNTLLNVNMGECHTPREFAGWDVRMISNALTCS